MEDYSVLMTVYYKEKPEYLRQSIQSMLDQTLPTNDFVLVCDGPLTRELDEVIHGFTDEYKGLFNIIRLEKNLGIGGAADAGLKQCKNDLVAKMDSDDIARVDRCKIQLEVMNSNPKLSVLGGQLAEFIGDVGDTICIRKVPVSYNEILQYSKRRNPFNNQTVVYRKSAALNVGGYANLKRCEDYDLYVRMLQKGFLAHNIDRVLVDYRLDNKAYQRRGMWSNLEGFIYVRWKIYKSGYSSLMDFVIPCLGQLILSMTPTLLKDTMYKKLLRNRGNE